MAKTKASWFSGVRSWLWGSPPKTKAPAAPTKSPVESNHQGASTNNPHDTYNTQKAPGKYDTPGVVGRLPTALTAVSILSHLPFDMPNPLHIFDNMPDFLSPIENTLHNGVYVLGAGAALFVLYEAFSY